MKPDFEKSSGPIPVVVQDDSSGTVLMLGYMNDEAFEKTKQESRVTFFSRSKNRLWTKGETSGNFLDVTSMQLDCDNDAILIKAKPQGPVCHTGSHSCFGKAEEFQRSFLSELQEIILKRKSGQDAKSYTRSLFEAGKQKIAQKVGEEALELALEAERGSDERFLSEAADLLFHYMVLLNSRDFSIADVEAVLRERHAARQ